MIFCWVKDFLLHHCCCPRLPLHQLQNLNHLINHGSPVIIIQYQREGQSSVDPVPIKCQSIVNWASIRNFSWHDTYLNTSATIQTCFPFPGSLCLKLSAHIPKIFFRLNKSLRLFETHCAFLSLFNPNIDLLQAVKVTKSGNHLSNDQVSKGYGSTPCLTSQTSLHACLQRLNTM